MRLSVGTRVIEFQAAPLERTSGRVVEPFAKKNNKTLGQTLLHRRYTHLAQATRSGYGDALQERLGDFLVRLKRANDPFYLRFLNPYGDAVYCEFRVADAGAARLKGLYVFTAGSTLKYVGKTTDSFGKRINDGYGRIHPKNCFVDGQATNCHLNALIAGSPEDVGLHVCPMADDHDIGATEAALITQERPDWNIQLNR